jgi:hypothetical protein
LRGIVATKPSYSTEPINGFDQLDELQPSRHFEQPRRDYSRRHTVALQALLRMILPMLMLLTAGRTKSLSLGPGRRAAR